MATPSLDTLRLTVKPATRGVGVPADVDPERIRRALVAARGGYPAPLFAVLEYFLQNDDEIPGAMRSLIEAVLQEGVVVTPKDDTPDAIRQAEDLREVFEELDTTALCDALLHGHYFGMRVAQPLWDVLTLSTGRTVQAPVTYELLPNAFLSAQRENKGDEHNTLFVGDRPYHAYPDGALLVYTARKLPSFESIDFTTFGCGVPVSRFACYSYGNHEDWAAYTELYGLPTILGTLLQGWNDADKDLLTKAVMGLANDTRAVITDKGKVDKIGAEGGDGTIFEKADEVWRRARARIIKSESLTDNMGKNGSNAAMVTVNGIRLDVARGLARRLARLLQRRLVATFCQLNYGKCLVAVDIPVKEIKNLLMELSIDKGLIDMGVDHSLDDVYARYGRRPPKDATDRIPGKRGGLDPFAALGT